GAVVGGGGWGGGGAGKQGGGGPQPSPPQAERRPATPAAVVGKEQDGPRFRRPAARFEPIPLHAGQRLEVCIVLGGDEPDGTGFCAWFEQEISQVTARFRQGSHRHACGSEQA